MKKHKKNQHKKTKHYGHKPQKKGNSWIFPLIVFGAAGLFFLIYVFMIYPSMSNASNNPPKARVEKKAVGDASLLNNYPFEVKKNVPTLVDIGRGTCAPCKAMAPIIKELQSELSGKANVIYIDLTKHPEAGMDFGIQSIPTILFYDARGKEVKRRIGFTAKDELLNELQLAGMR
jgi:thioredoxin 1